MEEVRSSILLSSTHPNAALLRRCRICGFGFLGLPPGLVDVADSRLWSRQGWTSWESDTRKSSAMTWGVSPGKGDTSIEQLAKDFGMSDASIYNWLKQADIDDGVRPGPR